GDPLSPALEESRGPRSGGGRRRDAGASVGASGARARAVVAGHPAAGGRALVIGKRATARDAPRRSARRPARTGAGPETGCDSLKRCCRQPEMTRGFPARRQRTSGPRLDLPRMLAPAFPSTGGSGTKPELAKGLEPPTA